MSERFYDKGYGRFIMPISANVAFTGTNTAAAQVLDATKRVVPFAARAMSAAAFAVAGATDAVAMPAVTLMKSVAGTGTFSAVGTVAITGTVLTGTSLAFTMATGTGADFAANDVVAIQVAAGTIAAASKTWTFSVGFQEMYN